MAFNSREYEHADLTLIVMGMDVIGLRASKYKEKIERELLYGKGRYPISIQSGNIAYEGEVTMLQSDYLKLRAAGGGSILSLSGDILSSYGNPTMGDAMITDRQEGCRFNEAEMSVKQGDKFMEVTMPYYFLRLATNV